MYLSRLYIKNYRSIKELDLHFVKGRNALVGRNNTGKSNVVRALDLVLGENSPTWAKSDNVTLNDFYSYKVTAEGGHTTKSADEFYIWCELQRDENEPLNYDELYKCYGYYVYGQYEEQQGGRIPNRILGPDLPQKYNTIFGLNADENQAKIYVNPKTRNQKTFESQFENKHHFAFAFLASKDQEENITKEIRFLYRENDQANWVLAFSSPIRNELLQSAIIPSFRDPSNQLRLSSWTWYGKLMRHLTESHAKCPELQEAFSKVKDVADGIFATVKNTVAQSSLQVAFPGTELFFQFNTDSKTDLYKNTVIYVDDGFKSQLTEKGSGIQSATIIGLFNYYTKSVNSVTSALLCIEEPEIYLHPHARRVISDRLDDFLDGGKNQVILTTHSSEFIRTTSPDLNVILVSRDATNSTRAQPVQIREFRDILVDNNQNELFFADKVIVCEGYDAHILRIVANELLPGKLDEQNVSIVMVGGKDRIAKMSKLVLKLGLKCYILADFDYLLRDKSDDCKQFEGAKQHESILSCGEALFTQESAYGTKGTEVYKGIEAFRTGLKQENEQAFYCAKRADDCGRDQLTGMLCELRKNGVGILNTDIEGLFKDISLLHDSKANLATIFELNSRLLQGQKLTDMLETAEIMEFLQSVISS